MILTNFEDSDEKVLHKTDIITPLINKVNGLLISQCMDDTKSHKYLASNEKHVLYHVILVCLYLANDIDRILNDSKSKNMNKSVICCANCPFRSTYNNTDVATITKHRVGTVHSLDTANENQLGFDHTPHPHPT